MKKTLIALGITGLLLSGCGAAGTVGQDISVKQVETPSGTVSCVIITAQGGGSVSIDCGWEVLP